MNKNGWGLRMELVIILLFVICLLIATIGLSKFGLLRGEGQIEYYGTDERDTFAYSILEKKIENAAINYYNNKYTSGTNDTVIISTKTLKATGYLSELYDGNNRKCTGYAKILKNGVCLSYLKCSRYRTSGYENDYE